jgi:hypothetical protein
MNLSVNYIINKSTKATYQSMTSCKEPKMMTFRISCHLKLANSQVLVTHTCNPSYSRGRDKEDCGLKPERANSSREPILKNPSQKGLVEWLKVKALSSSPRP